MPEIDPTAAASASFNRRVFVAISAAAALSASAEASAADAPPGPSVAEDDPAISVQQADLQSSGAAVPAYGALPKSAAPGAPSVVVVMHVWGVDQSIRDVVRRFAKAGYGAIAPNLYARFGAPNGDGATDYTIFRPYSQRLDRAQCARDLRAAAGWLAAKMPGTPTAITGFCMGGRIALEAAIDDADAFRAVAPFYGPLKDVDPKAIRIPVCGSYGARDTGIPAESVREFAAALTVPNDFRIYDDAGHAFFDESRPSYVASAAEDSWTRVLAFFEKYLRGAGQ